MSDAENAIEYLGSFLLFDRIQISCLNVRMDFERTKRGEIIPPSDWNMVTMDVSDVEDNGHLLEVVAEIHDVGLIAEILGDLLIVTKRDRLRDKADKLAVQSFNMGIAPSLECDGFKNIKFL